MKANGVIIPIAQMTEAQRGWPLQVDNVQHAPLAARLIIQQNSSTTTQDLSFHKPKYVKQFRRDDHHHSLFLYGNQSTGNKQTLPKSQE